LAIGPEAGYLSCSIDEARRGFYAGGGAAYGLVENLHLSARVRGAYLPPGASRARAGADAGLLFAAEFGLRYDIDVRPVTPYLSAGAGPIFYSAGRAAGGSVHLATSVGLGLDFAVTEGGSAGIAVAYYDVPADDVPFPAAFMFGVLYSWKWSD
jgi:opacity protein-like surface antigen